MAIFEVQVKTTQLFVDSFKIMEDCDMAEAKQKIVRRLSGDISGYVFGDTEQKIRTYPASSIISIIITPVEDV